MDNILAAPNDERQGTPNAMGVRLAYMKTWNDRVKEWREAHGLSMAAFGKKVGVSGPTVNDWEKGKIQKLEHENLMRLCKVMGMTVDYLLKGKPMPDIPQGASVGAWDKPEDLDPEIYVLIPHYDVELSAGDGAEWVAHSENDPITFRRRFFQAKGWKPENCRCLYVRGDSMEPTLENGYTVMIDITDTDPKDDEIYAVMYHGELFVKRLFRIPGGGIELRSDNPRHRSREVRGPELDHLRILGRKIWMCG